MPDLAQILLDAAEPRCVRHRHQGGELTAGAHRWRAGAALCGRADPDAARHRLDGAAADAGLPDQGVRERAGGGLRLRGAGAGPLSRECLQAARVDLDGHARDPRRGADVRVAQPAGHRARPGGGGPRDRARHVSDLPDIISEGSFYGMQSFDQALYASVKDGRVSIETALANATRPHDFTLLVQGEGRVGTTVDDVLQVG